MARREQPPKPERIRDISEAIYRLRLGRGAAERMIETDGDDGAKLRERAGVYDSLTRSYLTVLKVR